MKNILAGLAVVAILAGCSSQPERPQINEHTSWVTPSPTSAPTSDPIATDAPTNQPSPPATAFERDETAFVAYVRSKAIATSALEDQAIIDIGNGICDDFARGASIADVNARLVREGLDNESNAVFTGGSIIYLCPPKRG